MALVFRRRLQAAKLALAMSELCELYPGLSGCFNINTREIQAGNLPSLQIQHLDDRRPIDFSSVVEGAEPWCTPHNILDILDGKTFPVFGVKLTQLEQEQQSILGIWVSHAVKNGPEIDSTCRLYVLLPIPIILCRMQFMDGIAFYELVQNFGLLYRGQPTNSVGNVGQRDWLERFNVYEDQESALLQVKEVLFLYTACDFFSFELTGSLLIYPCLHIARLLCQLWRRGGMDT